MPWTADTLDVLSQAEVKAVLVDGGAPRTSDDALSQINTAIARRLDRLCGAVVQRTVTGERHNGGSCEIWLRQGPASAFTSVVEWQGTNSTTLTAETLGTLPADAYLAEQHPTVPTLYSGRIWRRSNGWDWPFYVGHGNVVVTYSAGRYATTAAVDDRFKEAAAIMLRNFWRSIAPSAIQDGEFDIPISSFPRFAIPNAVRQLLRDEIIEIPGIG